MRVICERTLDLFRAKRRCELCGMPIVGKADPHHVYARGMGGGSQLDIPLNLVALHRTCHISAEAGNVHREVFWLIIAIRERLPVGEVKAHVHRVLNAPKEARYVEGRIYYPDGREHDPEAGDAGVRPGVDCEGEGA